MRFGKPLHLPALREQATGARASIRVPRAAVQPGGWTHGAGSLECLQMCGGVVPQGEKKVKRGEVIVWLLE